ncbi:unnamed protein product, partial [Anisakis simplex]|uniref:FSH1 domain-containing protein n=1 Tax=Anisakis simplex TaxID=6269 RepID=A0A0M3KIJ8_ANISI
ENHFSSHDVTDLCTGFDESVKAVVDFAAKEACFAFGFSLVLTCYRDYILLQGAAFAFLLAAMRQRGDRFRDAKLTVVIQLVGWENSAKLVDLFDKDLTEVIIHPGGHFVPTLSGYKETVNRFMQMVISRC